MSERYLKVVDKVNIKWFCFFLIGTAVLATLVISRVFGMIDLIPEAAVDSEMSYTSDVFYKYLELQGEVGRSGYLKLHLVDYLFITQFYLFLSISMMLLIKKLDIKNKTFYLALIPLVAGVFDLLENLAVDISILAYPKKILFLGHALPIFTFSKFVVIYISFLFICLLAVFVLGKRIARSV